ncbi:g7670 [Coccomyxa viridis]|uniref:G7670 protein n=1 Tax=Coccomyxa viridis TaxID=1274662 RepID=A0ABP1FZK9_9CHLO
MTKDKHPILPSETAEGWEERQTPKGLRKDPKNRVERHKEEEKQKEPDHEKADKVDGKPVGQPVGSEETTSGKDKELKEQVFQRDQVDTVVEAQLGGGEKVIYSAKDGPPLDAQDPTPRS